jgi:hypothetical protein
VGAGEEGEYLRGFAVGGFAEADAEVGDEGHIRYYRSRVERR